MRVVIGVGGLKNVVQEMHFFVAWVTSFFAVHSLECVAKHLKRLSYFFAKTESQTLAFQSSLSQNAVKTPVYAGVLISPRVNIISRALQNASQNFTRFIANKNPVARKGRSGFRGEGGAVENEPGGRFGHFAQVSISAIKRFALVIFLTLSAAAQACIYQGSSTPCPADCIEDGGQIVCIKPVPAASPGGPLERDEQKWLYINSWYPGRCEFRRKPVHDSGAWRSSSPPDVGPLFRLMPVH
jgi:hypothetical protein